MSCEFIVADFCWSSVDASVDDALYIISLYTCVASDVMINLALTIVL